MHTWKINMSKSGVHFQGFAQTVNSCSQGVTFVADKHNVRYSLRHIDT